MLTRKRIFIPLAGLASALIFLLPPTSLLVLCLSFLPLLLVGLHEGVRAAFISALVASLFTGALSDIYDGLFFLAFVALPVVIFIEHALLHRTRGQAQEWYPTLNVLADLSLYGALVLLICSVWLAGEGGLKGWLDAAFTSGMKGMDPDMVRNMQMIARQWSFALFALMAWMWILMVYAMAVLANRLLALRHAHLRDRLALTPGGLNRSYAALTFLSGLLSAIPAVGNRFGCEVVFLTLLLPYFLSGVASLHLVSRFWPGRPFWLGLFYATLFLLWPALFVIGAGVYTQLAEMLDRRSGMG